MQQGLAVFFFTNTTNTRCVRSDQEFVIDLLNKAENSIIIYFADLQDKINDGDNNFIVNVPLTIQDLAINNKVIVIKQIPMFPVNVVNKILSNRNKLDEISYPREEWFFNENRLQVEEMYKSINNENVVFIDTFEIFCNEIKLNSCVGAIQEKIYIYDNNHPSVEGIMLILPKVELILNNLKD